MKRRSTQTTLDNTSAEANAAAKQIGELMRSGKKDEAERLKAKTGAWKEDIKKFGRAIINYRRRPIPKIGIAAQPAA